MNHKERLEEIEEKEFLKWQVSDYFYVINRVRVLTEALKKAAPFARHVSACNNHDGEKFQGLAEKWLNDLEALTEEE